MQCHCVETQGLLFAYCSWQPSVMFDNGDCALETVTAVSRVDFVAECSKAEVTSPGSSPGL